MENKTLKKSKILLECFVSYNNKKFDATLQSGEAKGGDWRYADL